MLDDLLTHLSQTAPDDANIGVLQPADPFLETAGEDLRRRIFITESIDGVVHCLRPEFTIPICVHHLEVAASSARYAYGGSVFRQARTGASEFPQVGLEDLGNADRVGADVAAIVDLISTLSKAGIGRSDLVVGDQNLFAVVVESLKLPQAVARRLVRNFGAPAILESQIERLTGNDVSDNGQAPTEAVQLALAGNGAELVAHVEEKMRAGNLAVNAGRSPQAIADRMIEKVLETQFQLDAESADILRNYLAMEVPMGEAPAALLKFAEATDLSFGLAGKEFFRRVDALAAAGVDLADMTYKASLGRNLEYYTGILFEAAIGDVVVAGGGRYDRLCSLLGAGTPVPAVGFSISLDRVEEVL